MKAKVKVRRRNGEWGVSLTVGNQGFWLDYYSSWEDARWMAKMLKIALAKAGAKVNKHAA